MQAIETRYIGATDFRGSRVKAICEAGSVTLPWDDALDSPENHDAAARALINKLQWWQAAWYRGAPKGSRGYVYVCARSFEILPMQARKGAL